MTSSTKIHTNLLVLYFLAVLNVFNLTPLQLVADLFLIFLAIIGVFILVLQGRKRVEKHFFSYLGLFSFIAIVSVLSSKYFLGQSFFSGIIAIQPYLLIFSCVYPLNLLARRNIKLKKLLQIILRLVWIYFFYLLLISILNVHYQIVSPISGQILEVGPTKASKALINFGVFIYLSKFLLNGKYRYLLWMLLLYTANHFADIQRGSLLIFLSIVLFGILKVSSLKTRTKFFVFLPLAASILFIISLKNPNITSGFEQKFSQVFLLFEDKDKVTDPSIYVRMDEVEFAWGHFLESPVFGKGVVRDSQKKWIFGNQYFYYPDIGIISVLFAFGLIGLLVFWKSVRDIRKVRAFYLRRSTPLLTFYLFCTSLILLTLSQGATIFFPLQFVFFISIIYLEIKKKQTFYKQIST